MVGLVPAVSSSRGSGVCSLAHCQREQRAPRLWALSVSLVGEMVCVSFVIKMAVIVVGSEKQGWS